MTPMSCWWTAAMGDQSIPEREKGSEGKEAEVDRGCAVPVRAIELIIWTHTHTHRRHGVSAQGNKGKGEGTII